MYFIALESRFLHDDLRRGIRVLSDQSFFSLDFGGSMSRVSSRSKHESFRTTDQNKNKLAFDELHCQEAQIL